MQEFHHFTSRFFRQVQENFRHLTSVFSLYHLETFCNLPSFSLGSAFSNFFNSSLFQGLSSMFFTHYSHCQCFAHSFLFASQRSNSLACSSSLFKICAPPLHAVGFVILCRSPALPSALFEHLIHSLLMLFLHLPCLIFLLHFLNKYTTFTSFLLLLGGVTPSRILPPTTQQHTNDSRHPSFLSI